MRIPGRPNLEIRLLHENDFSALELFCDKCKELGLKNNESFKAIKLDQMIMPYGQYFIGYDHDNDTIWNLAGIHRFPEISSNAWRCLFRGAQLPGYALQGMLSKNMMKTSYQMTYILPMQIEFILSKFPDSEFFTSTNNLNNNDVPIKSQVLDQRVNPLLQRIGVFEKIYDNMIIYNTHQSVWKVHPDALFRERDKVLRSMNSVDD